MLAVVASLSSGAPNLARGDRLDTAALGEVVIDGPEEARWRHEVDGADDLFILTAPNGAQLELTLGLSSADSCDVWALQLPERGWSPQSGDLLPEPWSAPAAYDPISDRVRGCLDTPEGPVMVAIRGDVDSPRYRRFGRPLLAALAGRRQEPERRPNPDAVRFRRSRPSAWLWEGRVEGMVGATGIEEDELLLGAEADLMLGFLRGTDDAFAWLSRLRGLAAITLDGGSWLDVSAGVGFGLQSELEWRFGLLAMAGLDTVDLSDEGGLDLPLAGYLGGAVLGRLWFTSSLSLHGEVELLSRIASIAELRGRAGLTFGDEGGLSVSYFFTGYQVDVSTPGAELQGVSVGFAFE